MCRAKVDWERRWEWISVEWLVVRKARDPSIRWPFKLFACDLNQPVIQLQSFQPQPREKVEKGVFFCFFFFFWKTHRPFRASCWTTSLTHPTPATVRPGCDDLITHSELDDLIPNLFYHSDSLFKWWCCWGSMGEFSLRDPNLVLERVWSRWSLDTYLMTRYERETKSIEITIDEIEIWVTDSRGRVLDQHFGG